MQSFATTHWSQVLAARDRSSPQSQEALAGLCAAYWYPLYVYVRRHGHHAAQAQDLTQEFFTRLLEKDYLRVVDRAKGRFRSFLLAALQHFLSNEYDRGRAKKRGGGRRLLSLDFDDAEHRYHHEPGHDLTAERLFERRWALTLLDQVLDRLRSELRAEGKLDLFEALKGFLAGGSEDASHAAAAKKLGMTPNAVKVASHRLRKRYRQLLREEIERTVHDPGQVDAEIRDLFAALGAG